MKKGDEKEMLPSGGRDVCRSPESESIPGAGRHPSPNKTVKYSFRLTEEQDIEFNKLLEKAGCRDNKSRFIAGKLLG